MRDFLEDAAIAVVWFAALLVFALAFLTAGCADDPPTAPTPPHLAHLPVEDAGDVNSGQP